MLWAGRWRAFALAFFAVLAWFVALQPSHERPWRAEVAVMPRAFIDGDRVRLTGVRDFEYRSADDFTPRYEEREVSLSRITGVDFYHRFGRDRYSVGGTASASLVRGDSPRVARRRRSLPGRSRRAAL